MASQPQEMRCRSCGQESKMLLQDPSSDSCHRTVCPKCQGDANRRILGWPSQRGGSRE